MTQTVFEKDGYLMRSHSETRWARMLDALRICWEYEPLLVETRHGGYLPDFYLPRVGIFVEVKGPHPTQVEVEKAIDASRYTGRPVVIACGDMFISPPGVGGGRLIVFASSERCTYSTFEFHELIRLGLGEDAYKRYLRAGHKTSHPGAFPVGDLLREAMLGTMDRSARESHLARISSGLNALKSQAFGQISLAEWAIGSFFERIDAKEAA